MTVEEYQQQEQRVKDQAKQLAADLKAKGLKGTPIVVPTNWRVFYKWPDGSVTAHIEKRL